MEFLSIFSSICDDFIFFLYFVLQIFNQKWSEIFRITDQKD